MEGFIWGCKISIWSKTFYKIID